MKKYKKVVLAGGNGYLGGVLAEYYSHLCEEVIILSRKYKKHHDNIRTITWDGLTETDWVKDLEDADMLINLCGKNVNCRYTKLNQDKIIESRVLPTKLLGRVILKMRQPPRLWINITSATIYRHAEDRPQDEETGEIGYGFSINVCRQWEESFFQSVTPGTRKIALRLGIVLGRADAAFPRLLNMVKFGLGGKQGDGAQYVSWIHEQDVAKCTEWLIGHPCLTGVINCTAPLPVKNKELMSIIRKAYGIGFGICSPAWLLELGALFIRTETELILKSRWVVPTRLLQSGYQFLFPKPEHAIKDLLSIRV